MAKRQLGTQRLTAKRREELERQLAEDIQHWAKPDPAVTRRLFGRPPRFRAGLARPAGTILSWELPRDKWDAPGGPQGDTGLAEPAGIPDEDED